MFGRLFIYIYRYIYIYIIIIIISQLVPECHIELSSDS